MPSLRKNIRDLASKAAYELKAELKAHVSPPEPISKYGDERRREANKRYCSRDYRLDDPNFKRLRGGGIEYRGRVSPNDIPLSDLLGYSPCMGKSDDNFDRSPSKRYSNVTEKAKKAEKEARAKRARESEKARKTRKATWATADEGAATAVAEAAEVRRTKVRFEEQDFLEKCRLLDEDNFPEGENPFEDPEETESKGWREEQQEAKRAVQEQRELEALEEESQWRRKVGKEKVENWIESVTVDDEQMAMEANVRDQSPTHYGRGSVTDRVRERRSLR